MRQNIVVIADKAHGNQYRFGGEVNEKTIEILHGFHFLKDEGVMAIILPHGVLFRGGAEERTRTKLLNDGHIDTVIGLPANLFYSTGIPVCILALKKCKKPDDVLKDGHIDTVIGLPAALRTSTKANARTNSASSTSKRLSTPTNSERKRSATPGGWRLTRSRRTTST